MATARQLSSRVLMTENVDWKKLVPLQSEGFKNFPAEEKERLRKSILDNSFIQPFYVWENKKQVKHCLDGFHRTEILKELENEGIAVPPLLPATFIDCPNKAEAAKLVLLYSSQYAHITPGGFQDFLKLHNLDAELVKMEISIPGITDIIEEELPYPDDLIGEPKDKPASIKITFQNVEELEKIKPQLEALLDAFAPGYILSVSAGEI